MGQHTENIRKKCILTPAWLVAVDSSCPCSSAVAAIPVADGRTDRIAAVAIGWRSVAVGLAASHRRGSAWWESLHCRRLDMAAVAVKSRNERIFEICIDASVDTWRIWHNPM